LKNKPIPAGPPVVKNCTEIPNSSIKPGIPDNPIIEYRNKRKKQLLVISKIQNNVVDGYDAKLLNEFKPFRDKTNRLI